MTMIESGNELAASKATLNELLKRIDRHVQVRDAKANEINELVIKAKSRKTITMDNFVHLRNELDLLTSEYAQINDICSYIKGFTACYDQVEPMIQDVASISLMIEKQEEYLKALSDSIMSTE